MRGGSNSAASISVVTKIPIINFNHNDKYFLSKLTLELVFRDPIYFTESELTHSQFNQLSNPVFYFWY